MTILLAQETGNQIFLLWGFILLGAVIALGALELLLPSGGLISAIAAIAAIGSVAAFLMYDMLGGIVALLLYVILGPLIIWAIFRFWINSPMARNIILGGSEFALEADGEEDEFMASEKARMTRLAELRALIGAEGTSITPLRPVGIIRIGGQRIDAMAETGSIDANTTVVVIDVYDNQIKVRAK
jgi:membrane-bound serine protease (ClpP class)